MTAHESVPMAVRAVGVDLADVSRLDRALERTPGLADRLFTVAEQAMLDDSGDSAARLFSVKEAVMKSLGRGVDSVAFTDICVELAAGDESSVTVELSGRATTRAYELGILRWTVDTQVIAGPTGPMSVAEVVAESALPPVGSP